MQRDVTIFLGVMYQMKSYCVISRYHFSELYTPQMLTKLYK